MAAKAFKHNIFAIEAFAWIIRSHCVEYHICALAAYVFYRLFVCHCFIIIEARSLCCTFCLSLILFQLTISIVANWMAIRDTTWINIIFTFVYFNRWLSAVHLAPYHIAHNSQNVFCFYRFNCADFFEMFRPNGGEKDRKPYWIMFQAWRSTFLYALAHTRL